MNPIRTHFHLNGFWYLQVVDSSSGLYAKMKLRVDKDGKMFDENHNLVTPEKVLPGTFITQVITQVMMRGWVLQLNNYYTYEEWLNKMLDEAKRTADDTATLSSYFPFYTGDEATDSPSDWDLVQASGNDWVKIDNSFYAAQDHEGDSVYEKGKGTIHLAPLKGLVVVRRKGDVENVSRFLETFCAGMDAARRVLKLRNTPDEQHCIYLKLLDADDKCVGVTSAL